MSRAGWPRALWTAFPSTVRARRESTCARQDLRANQPGKTSSKEAWECPSYSCRPAQVFVDLDRAPEIEAADRDVLGKAAGLFETPDRRRRNRQNLLQLASGNQPIVSQF